MPLGSAPNLMLGSALRSERACGHAPAGSALGAPETAIRSVEPEAGEAAVPYAYEARTNAAEATRTTRAALSIEFLETFHRTWPDHVRVAGPVQGAEL